MGVGSQTEGNRVWNECGQF